MSYLKKNLKVISNYYYYRFSSRFKISHNEWWSRYYAPLEKLNQAFHYHCFNDYELLKELKNDAVEIDRIKSNPILFGSMFYMLRKEESKS